MPNYYPNYLEELIELSRFAGERFDLVQAGGGNTSFRNPNDSTLWIKASGISLSEVTLQNGLCQLKLPPLLALLDELKEQSTRLSRDQLEARTRQVINNATITENSRPSIETLLHCALNIYTLHTHPIAVTSLVCQKDFAQLAADILPDALVISYHTPGAELALALMKALRNRSSFGNEPTIILFQNHGLLVSASSASKVIEITNTVASKLEEALALDLSCHRFSNQISNLIKSSINADHRNNICSHLSQDKVILQLLEQNLDCLLAPPACPDQLVYCGQNGLYIESLTDTMPIKNYFSQFNKLPQVIIFDSGETKHLFLIGQNIKKCKEIEEVLKAHAITLRTAKLSNVQFLSKTELNYLANWEAEKYRQEL